MRLLPRPSCRVRCRVSCGTPSRTSMRRSPPPSVPTHSRPWPSSTALKIEILLDQRTPKGLHKRDPTQGHRLQRLRRKDRLRHGLKEGLQRGHIPLAR